MNEPLSFPPPHSPLLNICRQPMYKQVAASLRRHIRQELTKGDRLPNEHELAKGYGVSLITIKGALKLLADEKIITRHRGRGTHVNISHNISEIHALIIELDIERYHLPYYQTLVEETVAEGRRRGIEIQVYCGNLVPGTVPTEITSKEFLRDLRQDRLRGIITLGTSLLIPWKEEAEARGLVITGSGVGCPYGISWNAMSAIDLTLDHLTQRGCRRVAAIGWRGFSGEHTATESYFLRACQEHGLPSDPLLFRSDLHPLWKGSGWAEFRELWTASSEKPDGLLIIDGELMNDVLHAIDELPAAATDGLHIVTAIFPWVPLPSRPNLHFRFLPIAPTTYAKRVVDLYLKALTAAESGQRLTPESHLLPLRIRSKKQMEEATAQIPSLTARPSFA